MIPQDDITGSEAVAFSPKDGGIDFGSDDAFTTVTLNSSDAGQPPKERARRPSEAAEAPLAPPEASAGDAPPDAPAEAPEQPDGPLTPEQIAFYRRRLASGFYQQADVQRRIAERIADDLVPPHPDRR